MNKKYLVIIISVVAFLAAVCGAMMVLVNYEIGNLNFDSLDDVPQRRPSRISACVERLKEKKKAFARGAYETFVRDGNED